MDREVREGWRAEVGRGTSGLLIYEDVRHGPSLIDSRLTTSFRGISLASHVTEYGIAGSETGGLRVAEEGLKRLMPHKACHRQRES
jgi:hypothetical protein